MTPTAPGASAERQSLEAAIRANPSDPNGWLNLAKHEAKLWIQDPQSTDLNRILAALERGHGLMPPENREALKPFLAQLQQRGAPIGPLLQSGSFPGLSALASGQAAPAQPAAPAAQPQAPAAAQHADHVHVPAGSAARIRDLNIGEVSTVKIKQWLDGNAIEELVNAYPMIDNFRTRRVVIDKIGEQKTPLAAAALIRMLAQTHDENLETELKKRLTSFDPETLNPQLAYDSSDLKNKLAVVTILATLKNEAAVEPLMEALHDPDGHVRAIAVAGLGEMFEASGEWIGQLASMIRSDPDPQVRMAAARGLQAAGSKDALSAFEMASQDASFDANLLPILQDMKTKLGGGKTRSAQGPAAAKASVDVKGFMKLGGAVAFVALLLFGIYKIIAINYAPPGFTFAPPPTKQKADYVKAETDKIMQQVVEAASRGEVIDINKVTEDMKKIQSEPVPDGAPAAAQPNPEPGK